MITEVCINSPEEFFESEHLVPWIFENLVLSKECTCICHRTCVHLQQSNMTHAICAQTQYNDQHTYTIPVTALLILSLIESLRNILLVFQSMEGPVLYSNMRCTQFGSFFTNIHTDASEKHSDWPWHWRLLEVWAAVSWCRAPWGLWPPVALSPSAASHLWPPLWAKAPHPCGKQPGPFFWHRGKSGRLQQITMRRMI